MKSLRYCRTFCLICILGFSLGYCLATEDPVKIMRDSLSKVKTDSAKCLLLARMIESEVNDLIWPTYNNELIKIARTKIKTKNPKEKKFFLKKLAEGTNNCGYLAQLNGNIPYALACYRSSYHLHLLVGNLDGVASCLSNIGSIYYWTGKTYSALKCHRRCFKIYRKMGDHEGIALALNSMATAYHHLGNIPKSLKYYDECLKNYLKTDDLIGTAQVISNMGVLYAQQHESKKALEYHIKSYRIRKKLRDVKGMSLSLEQIGSALQQLGKNNEALNYFLKSLKLQISINYKQGMAYSLGDIASILEQRGDTKRALSYYRRSLYIRKAIDEKVGVCQSLQQIGSIYYLLQDYENSKIYLEESLELGREIGFPDNISPTALKLSQIYEKENNSNRALEAFKLHIAMRDSISNIENRKATYKIQAQYEFDKEKAIQHEKFTAEGKKQTLVIILVSIFLILALLFSVLLYNRFKTTHRQKVLIEKKESETQLQKRLLELKQKEILDSITYAKRIQDTLLAQKHFLEEHLGPHFIFFKPKSIVSGDFYWAAKQNNYLFLAVCDSTGHGVPGAFMSLLNIGFLSEAINEKSITEPHEIFNYVRKKLTETISKDEQKDGFDGTLVRFDSNSNSIVYASAFNKPVLVRNGEIQELKADKMPVGIGLKTESFMLFNFESQPQDKLYLFSDGFADQFGGPNGKKFKSQSLISLIKQEHSKDMNQQKVAFSETFNHWMNDYEQLDDVCVLGIEINKNG